MFPFDDVIMYQYVVIYNKINIVFDDDPASGGDLLFFTTMLMNTNRIITKPMLQG